MKSLIEAHFGRNVFDIPSQPNLRAYMVSVLPAGMSSTRSSALSITLVHRAYVKFTVQFLGSTEGKAVERSFTKQGIKQTIAQCAGIS
jgi:hypothetical protein